MKFDMHNHMEDMVRDKMPAVLDGMPSVCRCERCELDRVAIALNRLPPRYVVTKEGKLYARIAQMQNQVEADVVRAITDAALLVEQNPFHEEENI
ncbi:MAG: late competence development ComFB family protein [Defluviitaleaceae bacterium]|nr:late competence development ComFB family protein [Defluviitaleaceae bacterium]